MTVTVSDLQQRKEAAKALGRLLTTQPGRDARARADEMGCSATLVCLETDTVESVIDRAHPYRPPVMLAVYWSERDHLAVGLLSPEAESTVSDDDVCHVRMHRHATVGMLIDSGARLISPSKWDRRLTVFPIAIL